MTNEKKVDFFIIGAPKTGTTSIAEILAKNPSVNFSKPKEPNYYSTDIVDNKFEGKIEYLSLFSDWEKKITGEASTTYLYSTLAIDNILKDNPNAKFIVGIREYVSLAKSQYYQLLKVGCENANSFELAWRLQEQRARGKNIPIGCDIPFNLQYKEVISLGKYIDILLSKVKRDNVHFYLFDDLAKDFESEYKKILNFLNISDFNEVLNNHSNKAGIPKNIYFSMSIRFLTVMRKKLGFRSFFGIGEYFRKLNTKNDFSAKIDDQLKIDIIKTMKDDRRMLQNLTGLDLDRYWS